jgi:O-antigen/teichoic acid export membrane protein
MTRVPAIKQFSLVHKSVDSSKPIGSSPSDQPQSRISYTYPSSVSARNLSRASLLALVLRSISALLGVAVVATLGRGMSHQSYGAFSVIVAFDALAKSLGDLGSTQVGIRMMSEEPDQRGRIAAALVLAQTAGASACIVLFGTAAFLLFPAGSARIAALILIASWVSSGLTELQAVSDAQLRPQVASWAVLLQSVSWLAGVLALTSVGAPLWAYSALLVVSNLLGVGFITVRSRGLVKLQWRGSVQLIPTIVRQALLLGVAGVLVSAYYRIDGVLLFHYVGSVGSSYYSAAYRFIDVLQFIPATLCVGVIPIIAQVRDGTRGDPISKCLRLYHLLVGGLLSVGTIAAVGGILDSRTLLRLTYGAKYLAAAPLLRVLLCSLPFVMLNVGLLGVVIAYRATDVYLITTAIATAANLLANMMLIPRFGAIAAAWVATGTEAFVAVALLTGIWRRLGLSLPWWRLAVLGAAAGLAVSEGELVHGVPGGWARPAIPCCIFIGMLIGGRCIRIDEMRMLLSRQIVLDRVDP